MSCISPIFLRKSCQKSDEIDVKSGAIYFIHDGKNVKAGKHKVYLKVFKNIYEHHIQIYTDSEYKIMLGYLSLRKCRIQVTESTNLIYIVNEKTDEQISNTGIVLEALTKQDLHEWVSCLTPNPSMADSELSPHASQKIQLLRMTTPLL